MRSQRSVCEASHPAYIGPDVFAYIPRPPANGGSGGVVPITIDASDGYILPVFIHADFGPVPARTETTEGIAVASFGNMAKTLALKTPYGLWKMWFDGCVS